MNKLKKNDINIRSNYLLKMNDITICYKAMFYNITKEPYESTDEAYKRLWFIIKNYKNYPNYKELVSISIINNNKNKGMEYII